MKNVGGQESPSFELTKELLTGDVGYFSIQENTQILQQSWAAWPSAPLTRSIPVTDSTDTGAPCQARDPVPLLKKHGGIRPFPVWEGLPVTTKERMKMYTYTHLPHL